MEDKKLKYFVFYMYVSSKETGAGDGVFISKTPLYVYSAIQKLKKHICKIMKVDSIIILYWRRMGEPLEA